MSQSPLLDDVDEFEPKCCLFGHPGIGKGALVRQLFPNVIEMRLSAIDIADIRGVPEVPHEGGPNGLR